MTRKRKKNVSELVIFTLWMFSTVFMWLILVHQNSIELAIGIICTVYFLGCSVLSTIANLWWKGDK